MGHCDDVEADLAQPIVSISLGSPAIFLAGGDTKDTEPLALLLHSGDVVVMAGVARRRYHGGWPPSLLPLLNLEMYESCPRTLHLIARTLSLH